MQIWEQFLETLEKDFGQNTVNRWLRSLKLLRFDACNLYFEAEDSFQTVWFEEHIRARALQTLKTSHGKPIRIHLQTKKSISFPKTTSTPHAPTLHFTLDPLDKDLTYEHFILSEENALTFQIFAELVHFNLATYTFNLGLPCSSPYNPIFLYGTEGSGKTHVLCATALAMQQHKTSVLYVTAETFSEHMIKAIRYNQMAAFRHTYRCSDVLIVDNIQHFAHKMATQEEFFHTFNYYHMAGKQLILASSAAPNKLEGIESRLISRFEWGIPVSLHPLPQAKLSLLLLKKLKTYELSLSREISAYLLSIFTTPHMLTQALQILSYKRHLNTSMPLTLDMVKTVTQSLVDQVLGKTVSTEKILRAISEVFDVKIEEMQGKGQTKDIVFPRQMAMYLLRNKLHMPYPKIGKVFFKDHSTVMSGVNHITECVKHKEARVMHSLEHLEKKISHPS